MFLTINPAQAGTVSGYFTPGGYYGGSSGYYEWQDYCPLCHHHDCLGTYVKGVNEVSCYLCGADYDGCTGADKHQSGARAWLTPYNPPPPAPQVMEPLSDLNIFKNLICDPVFQGFG